MPLKREIEKIRKSREYLARSSISDGTPEEQRRPPQTSLENDLRWDPDVSAFLREFPEEEGAVLARIRELAAGAGGAGDAGAELRVILRQDIRHVRGLLDLARPFQGGLLGGFDLLTSTPRESLFDLLEYHAKLRRHQPKIEEIAKLLGRLSEAEDEELAEALKQPPRQEIWRFPRAARSAVVGVRESDDLSSLLSSEAALLTSPETEILFAVKWADKKLQTYDYALDDEARLSRLRQGRRRVQRRRRGPMIILLDTSGSMAGEPERQAKAFALALVGIARRQRRDVHLLSFSGDVSGLTVTPRVSMRQLFDFLLLSFHAGTDFNQALDAGLQKLREGGFRQADLIFLSDAQGDAFDPPRLSALRKARESGHRFYTLAIGKAGRPDLLAAMDDGWRFDGDRITDLARDLRRYRLGIGRPAATNER